MANQGKAVSHAAIKEILGKALEDENFRKDLLANPADALKNAGYHPHKDAVKFFEALNNKKFAEAAKHVKPKKSDHDPIEVAGEI